MDYSFLLSSWFLSIVGGFVGALRSSVKDSHKTFLEKILDIVIGMMMGFSLVDYFLPNSYPKVAIVIGLMSGTFGGYLMDTLQSLSPTLAKGIVDAILGRLGYHKEDKNSD